MTQLLFSGRKTKLLEGYHEWTPQMKLAVDADKKETERVRKRAKRAQDKAEFVALQQRAASLQNEVCTLSLQKQALGQVICIS